MSSISYPDELGIIDARLRKHQERAVEIADRLRGQIRDILEYQESLSVTQLAGHREHFSFAIDAEAGVVFPLSEPLRAGLGAAQEGVVPEKGFQSRQRALDRARTLEHGACGPDPEHCDPNSAAHRTAATIYDGLSSFSDTGAEALLGLARIHRRAGDIELAAPRYLQLAQRFGDRVNDSDIPYRLLADIGLSELAVSPEASFSLLRGLVGQRYEAPNALLEVAAYSAVEALQNMPLEPAELGELASLEKGLALAQGDSVFARRLNARAQELVRSAGSRARSMVVPWDPTANLVYRTTAEGGVRGYLLREKELQEMAQKASANMGLHEGLIVRVQAMQEGAVASTGRKARVSLGPLLPHLALLLWDQEKSGDGFADIAEARRRHRAITGGLVVVLVLGLWATIRGAARERELARLKSDFVSTVSHELKTPLTSIRMFAEMLQERVAGEDREREAHYHGIIVKESERLGLLIANLLDYSQIERGTRRYADVNTSASELVRQACETFARMKDEEEQEVAVNVCEGAENVQLHVDRGVIEQCLINLLSNAAKYGEGKPIEVRAQLSAKSGVVELQVRDQGPGIASGEHTKIFREFYRAPEAVRSAIEGTGLGLALVKRHVEAQGGQVSVSSIVGKGATFTIELPMVDA